MTKIDYLLKQYENILDWYKQSQEKAKFLVTVNTLVLGVLNGLVFIGADKIRSVQPLHTMPIWILLAVAGAALISSYLFILRVMWSRHHALDASLKVKERLWFFGDVALLTRQDYRGAVVDWTEQDLEETMVSQNHILSKNVRVKHEALNWAISFTIVALILLFALGVAYGITVANTPLQPTTGCDG